jgi:hypothetical protein
MVEKVCEERSVVRIHWLSRVGVHRETRRLKHLLDERQV